jgi:hypothetical protein
MPEVDIRTVSDDALGQHDWMVLVIARKVVLAVRRSAQLGPEALSLMQEAIDAALRSLELAAA